MLFRSPSGSCPFASCISGSFPLSGSGLFPASQPGTLVRNKSKNRCHSQLEDPAIPTCRWTSISHAHLILSRPHPHPTARIHNTLQRLPESSTGHRWPSRGTAFLQLVSVGWPVLRASAPSLFSWPPPWYLSPSVTLPTPSLTSVNPSANKGLLPGLPEAAGGPWGWPGRLTIGWTPESFSYGPDQPALWPLCREGLKPQSPLSRGGGGSLDLGRAEQALRRPGTGSLHPDSVCPGTAHGAFPAASHPGHPQLRWPVLHGAQREGSLNELLMQSH